VGLDQYVDNRRGMPGQTGVIDIAAFLGALESIAYDGPVMAEPFEKRLGTLPPDQAVRETSESLDLIFARAGVKPA
jgi:sugar phosphate isomerase/epimerase